MTVCNGYPEVTVVPPVGNCCTNSAIYAINKLPGTYPQVLSMESLQEAYGYTVDDFNLPAPSWYVYSYAISGEYSTQAESVESTCSAAPVDAENDGLYYSYLPTVKKLQGGRDWVVSPLTCEEPSNGITKGPATLILADMSILPSPTVTPALKVRVNNPWYNVLRASANNILYANPPKGTCKSGKWKLVYSQPGAFPKIEWECEDEEESKSSYSRPSGSAGADYCKNLSIDIDLIGINYKTTVKELQGKETWCALQITYTWRGTEEFTGDDLYLYISSYNTNTIHPKVYANFGSNIAGPTTVWQPLQALGAIAPPDTAIRKRVITQPLYLLALPCESPKDQPDYAPCCTDPAENGVGETKIEFYASASNCGITKSVQLTVACDDEEDDEEVLQGTLDVSLFFRDEQETTSFITLGTCGEPITTGTMVYLCAHIEVIDGDYCSCGESENIGLSRSGVEAVFYGADHFTIPKGYYSEGAFFDLAVPIIISGDGKSCSGDVKASAFGESADLSINQGCRCEEEPVDIDIDIKGDEYIGVKPPYRDVTTGKITFELYLKNYEKCETADNDAEEEEEEQQLEDTFGDFTEGNPENPNDDPDD